MASYVVMQPPRGGEERAVLVRDGFRFWAFVLPFVWLLVHRLWIEAGLVIAAGLLIAAASAYFDLGPVATVLSLGLGAIIGMEAASLRIEAMRRRGWREWGVVEAENAHDAEVRFVAEAAGDVAPDDTPPAPALARPVPPRRPSPALGLFAYPDRG